MRQNPDIRFISSPDRARLHAAASESPSPRHEMLVPYEEVASERASSAPRRVQSAPPGQRYLISSPGPVRTGPGGEHPFKAGERTLRWISIAFVGTLIAVLSPGIPAGAMIYILGAYFVIVVGNGLIR